MLIAEVAALVRRRWYLVLATVLLACGVGYGAWATLPTQYESQTTVVLLPPSNKEVTGENRLLGLGTIGQAVDVMIRSMSARDVRLEIEGAAPGATYTVTPDFTSNAPLMVLTVSGERDAVGTLMTRLQDEVPRRLAEIQKAVATPEQWQIVSLPVARDPEPVAQTKAKMRTTVMVVGAALVLGLLVIAGLDSLLRARAGRGRTPDDEQVPQDDDPVADSPEVAAPEAAGDPGHGAAEQEAVPRPGAVVPIGRRSRS